jgi:hypothetical protein
MKVSLKQWVIVCGCLFLLATTAAASADTKTASSRVFYLALKRGECGIKTSSPKTVTVVSCSNPRHTFEVYAIRHGGWGHGAEPSSAALANKTRQLCLTAYAQVTGRPLPARPYGYQWFAPDPGKEEAEYGDKVICSFSHWPQSNLPLGSGWHVH